MRNRIVIIRNAAKQDFGGGEKVPVLIARGVIDNSNMQPVILSGSKKLQDFAASHQITTISSPWLPKQNWSGVHIILTPFYLIWQLVLTAYYIALFIKLRPFVVHIQSKDDFIAGTLAARLLGVPVLWSDYADLKHIFTNHTIWYKNPIGKIVYACGYLTESIVVVSEQDKQLVSTHIPDGVVKDKLQVIYNGAFDTLKRLPKNDTFTFVSSSRIVTDKGIGELIKAFDRLHAKYSDTQLHILGDGPEKRYFEDLARQNPSITFLGFQHNPLEYVEKSHVFILPTYHEGFSIALVEACMLEMPIIATNVGGNPEIIHNTETGLLVKVKDVDSLFDAMEKLLGDEAMRVELSKNARNAYVDKFDFETIIKKHFIPLYERYQK